MRLPIPLSFAIAVLAAAAAPAWAETISFGIGTQDTTTNTVTAGAVIRELKLLDKYLPKSGAYAGATYAIEWQNFTSGPPVTNAMMANKLHIGAMGDYPLVVNGFTFQSNPESKSQLIAVAAYNILGSGNGLMVHKDSPYFELDDLKGKVVSVPFGSAAHGMVLKAFQDRNWAPDTIKLVSQSPEVGSTNLQEKKIDGHADFVPFAELLPHRGFARKIFDGVETKTPTWHGVVARTDFAQKYPEIIVAYLKAMVEANAWVKANPKLAAEKISQWTGTDKEVVYIFLGPGGIMTLDPTIKVPLIEAAAGNVKVLQNLGRMKEFDLKAWVNDSYLREAFRQLDLDYDKAAARLDNYEITGEDTVCKKPITESRSAGEIWIDGEDIKSFASTRCTLSALGELGKQGKKIAKVYLFDKERGIKVFADQAYFVVANTTSGQTIDAYMLKKDALAGASQSAGAVVDFAAAVKSLASGG